MRLRVYTFSWWFLCLLTLPGGTPTHASETVDPASRELDYLEGLDVQNQVFTGIVESASKVVYTPSGPCADGLRPYSVSQFVIRIGEVLHGGGLHGIETVRYFGRSSAQAAIPGARVLVSANRSCADQWRLWGNVFPLSKEDDIVPTPAHRSKGAHWVKEHGRPANLKDLVYLSKDASGPNPARHFQKISTLHVVVITAKTTLSRNAAEFQCRVLAQAAGPQAMGPTRLTFAALDQAPCMFIGVGDTLVVPGSANDQGTSRNYHTCADYFKVDHGYLPGTGIYFEHLLDGFARSGATLSLKTKRKGEEP